MISDKRYVVARNSDQAKLYAVVGWADMTTTDLEKARRKRDFLKDLDPDFATVTIFEIETHVQEVR